MSHVSSATKVTGICPSGFSAGWYGVGKCYLIIRERMAAYIAQMQCRTYKAQLVAIETKSENDYLANTIYKQGKSTTVIVLLDVSMMFNYILTDVVECDLTPTE